MLTQGSYSTYLLTNITNILELCPPALSSLLFFAKEHICHLLLLPPSRERKICREVCMIGAPGIPFLPASPQDACPMLFPQQTSGDNKRQMPPLPCLFCFHLIRSRLVRLAHLLQKSNCASTLFVENLNPS